MYAVGSAPRRIYGARICVSITVTMAYQVNSMRKRQIELHSLRRNFKCESILAH